MNAASVSREAVVGMGILAPNLTRGRALSGFARARGRHLLAGTVAAAALMVTLPTAPASAAPGDTTLASTSDAGVKANSTSFVVSLSLDATKVAFQSAATNLDPADTDTNPDVYVKDLVTGDITLASTSDAGVKANSSSIQPFLSTDGTKVAFQSTATNLDPADTDPLTDVYVKDLITGDLTLASTSDAGVKANSASFDPFLSANGTKVAFHSNATNFDPADTVGTDVYVKDLITGDITLASTSDAGVKANSPGLEVSLSADGTRVTFSSTATNLDPADTDTGTDVYVKDLVTGDITLASTSDAGVKANGNSIQPFLSADGTKVAFPSHATNLDPADTNTGPDVYVKDLITGEITLVSTSDTGVKANNSSLDPFLSADGRKAAFYSHASNLDPADSDNLADVYVKDLVTGDVSLVSTSDTGVKANSTSFEPFLSADTTKVAFASNASNLDPADTDTLSDVYVKEFGDPTGDADADGDGVPNGTDNCSEVANPGQADADGDGQGDACDTDTDTDADGDGVPNGTDNCSEVANPGQADADGDGQGDACDTDTDTDPTATGCRTAPTTARRWPTRARPMATATAAATCATPPLSAVSSHRWTARRW